MRACCVPVCFLLVAMVLPPGDGEAVVALETYRGYLCRPFFKNDTFQDNTKTVGVCVLARPEITQPHNPAFIVSLSSTNVTVAAGIDFDTFWVKIDEEEMFVFNETLRAEAWNRVCLSLSSTTPMITPTPILEEQDPESQTYEVWASLHGRLLDTPGAVNLNGLEDVRVCLGAASLDNASFTGFVTGVIFLAAESEWEALLPTNCSAFVAANELTHPLDASWESKGPVLTLDEQLEEDPCAAAPRTVVLEGPRGYEEFLRLCQSLGGHFPTEEEAAKGQVETYNCTSGQYVSWGSGGEAGQKGPTVECPVLLIGGGAGQQPCLRELNCTLCQVPTGLRYTLFGPRRNFDRYYTLVLATPPDGTFSFQGEETSIIEREATGWALRSRLHREELHQDLWLMGRHPWSSSLKGTAPTLTFTVCNAIQFSSNDGVCLLRSQRCDGRTDSPDKSDEENCGSQRTIGKDTYYDTRVNPFFGEKQKGTMFFQFDVMVIHKMSTEKGNAQVEVNLYLDWEDERLRFIDTKMHSTGFPCEQVWTPTLNIFAGYSSGPNVNPQFNRTECYVYWNVKPYEEQRLEDPLMGRFTAKVNITQYINLILEYPCQLRVSKYPFGRYTCNLTFAFFRDHESIAWKSTSPTDGDVFEIPYSENKDLLDFRLEKVTAVIHSDKVTFMLHLAGQPDYHLTNSFLPSSLMFVICYSSLFFPIAGFNERIMVSLTSLLVLVALFSQASETYVRTPYYKLIDVWYVGLIFLCFSVVIVNALVNYLRVLKVKSQTNLMKKVLVAKKCNIGGQVFLLSCFLSLVFMFVLFSNNNL